MAPEEPIGRSPHSAAPEEFRHFGLNDLDFGELSDADSVPEEHYSLEDLVEEVDDAEEAATPTAPRLWGSEISFTPPRILSPQQALEGHVPILLIERPNREWDAVPPLLRAIAHTSGGNLNVGVVARLSDISPKDGSDFLDKCDAAALRIADPYSFRYFDQVPGRPGITRRPWPYQQDSLTSADDTTWIPEVVGAQVATGANIILSPGRWLAGDNPDTELTVAIEQAELTAKSAEGMPTAINLTIAAHWLTQEHLRDRLLQAIVDAEPAALYLRVLWSALPHYHAHLIDKSVLEGYKELCEVCEDEGIAVVLPNADLTGWLTLAWGSMGFGTGLTSGARSFAQLRGGGGGGTTTPPKERYFARYLLHTILRAEHQQIEVATGPRRCECEACAPIRSAYPWTRAAAGWHHVRAMARLTSELGANPSRSTRLAAIRKRVDAAIEMSGLVDRQIVLEGDSKPTHLTAWREALGD